MSRYSSMLAYLSFGLLSLSQPLQAAEYSTSKPLVMSDKSEKTANPSYIALMLDYVPAADNLYGITLAPYHFDNNYQQGAITSAMPAAEKPM